ncbi:hypothetical protein J6590_087791 [Homalodisca vitripennis]|nr:hypothetical protein J6590_087791 [Homalodisca vitripennis]
MFGRTKGKAVTLEPVLVLDVNVMMCERFSKLDFTGSLLNRNRRSRKRAPPKLGAKDKKNHMPLVGRETKRDKISKREKAKNNYLPKVGELASHGHQDEQLTVRDTRRLCRTCPTAPNSSRCRLLYTFSFKPFSDWELKKVNKFKRNNK